MTRADRAFCRNWTVRKRNLFPKEFGPALPLPMLLLARRLAPVQRWCRFCIAKDHQRNRKKLLRAYPRRYRGNLSTERDRYYLLSPAFTWCRKLLHLSVHAMAFTLSGAGSCGEPSAIICFLAHALRHFWHFLAYLRLL